MDSSTALSLSVVVVAGKRSRRRYEKKGDHSAPVVERVGPSWPAAQAPREFGASSGLGPVDDIDPQSSDCLAETVIRGHLSYLPKASLKIIIRQSGQRRRRA